MQPQLAAVDGQTVTRHPTSSDSDTQERLRDKRRRFRAFEENKERELQEQREHRRYYHAKQWTDAEVRTLKKRGQPIITDNRIGRKIDFLVGVEQRMRRDPKGFPRTPRSEKTADLATAGLRYVCDNQRWDMHCEDATLKGLVSAIGTVWIGIEPGPQGMDVAVKPVPEDRFFYDPRSERKDFSDAWYMGVHLWMDVEEAKRRWPHHEQSLAEMLNGDGIGEGSGFVVEQDREEQWGDFEHRRVRIVEFWEKVYSPQHGREVWYYCFFSGHIDLESGISPYMDEDGYPDTPYIAWSSYVDERGDRYGPIRNMKSMQDEINHRRSKFLHLINTRQTHAKTGVVDDADHMRTQLARPDGHVDHNGEWGVDVGVIDNSVMMQGQAELLEQAQGSLENLGPNPGLIGKGNGMADASGRALLAQRDSGMTELSPVFQQIRDFKIRCYRKMLGRAKQAWTNERWIRITDDEGAPQFIGLNQFDMDPMTGQITVQNNFPQVDVDIILEEGPDTITMNEELLQTISQMGEMALGPMGRVVIELSNVANKEKLLALLDKAGQPNPQVVEMEQRMAALEAGKAEADIEKTHVETDAKRVESVTKLAEAFVDPAAVPVAFDELSSANDLGAAPPPLPGSPAPAGNALDPTTAGLPPNLPPELAGQPIPGSLPLDPSLFE